MRMEVLFFKCFFCALHHGPSLETFHQGTSRPDRLAIGIKANVPDECIELDAYRAFCLFCFHRFSSTISDPAKEGLSGCPLLLSSYFHISSHSYCARARSNCAIDQSGHSLGLIHTPLSSSEVTCQRLGVGARGNLFVTAKLCGKGIVSLASFQRSGTRTGAVIGSLAQRGPVITLLSDDIAGFVCFGKSRMGLVCQA